MHTNDVLDIVGNLVSQLKAFGAKLPTVVPTASVSGGVKPKLEALEAFEQAVSRFRDQAPGTKFQRLSGLLIECLEAFETGWMLKAVQALLGVLDAVELMQRESLVTVTAADETRLKEYRHTLHKILPGNKPELEGAGKWM